MATWAILAACVLTVATVGMGVGVLLMLRSSWAETTWPPTGSDLPADVRARRNLRNLGIILLAPLPVAVAGLAWAIADGSVQWDRLLLLALLVIIYAAAGVWLLRSSRVNTAAARPRASHTRRPADDGRAADSEGWRPLGGPLEGPFLTAAIAPSVIVLLVAPAQLLLILDDVPWGIAIWVGAVIVGVAVGLVLLRRSRMPVAAHPGTGRIRLGRKTIGWSEVTRAELFVDPPWPGTPRTLILTLGDAKGARGRVVLRRSENLELSDDETDLALRVIDASAIELPHDKDDPRGRFSRQLYPNSLTKAEASALVARPPGMNDDLPTRGQLGTP